VIHLVLILYQPLNLLLLHVMLLDSLLVTVLNLDQSMRLWLTLHLGLVPSSSFSNVASPPLFDVTGPPLSYGSF